MPARLDDLRRHSTRRRAGAPDGQPIILLNDRQTIGGYPRLGALTPQAVARLAQCLPGQSLWLQPTTQDSAQRSQRRLLAQWQ